MNLLTMSATRMARLIAESVISSQDAVAAHIDRLVHSNPRLNAVVVPRYEQAMEEARLADEFLAENGPEACGPFHGVPCTIKESFAFAGLPNTSGMVSRKPIRAAQDAPTVTRLKKSGAVPLGLTNTSELCMWMESSNKVYGVTNNAYDRRRIAGGSSGGEGSVIGSGASPFGLGSDVGGSIRMPAFFNGVFGHKPTGGLVPNTGQIPEPENELSYYTTTGPLCRRAEDLMPLLRVLAGPDGKDPQCKEMPLGDPAGVRVADLTVTSIPGNGAVRVDPRLAEAQEAVVRALAAEGCRVRRARVPRLKNSFFIWSSMLMNADQTPFHHMLTGGALTHPLLLLARWAVGRSPHTLPAIILSLLEKLPLPVEKFIREGEHLREDLLEILGDDGVILYPSYSCPAPPHHLPLVKVDHFTYTAIINVMGFPATQVPLGVTRTGVPLGVQVVGRPGADHETIAVAMELERIFGGWTPPWTLPNGY
ncbi:MAG: amidase [Deltaproteobacteria bacterium]|nr:amidase [Deltaproteobacteria bacterium]